MSAKQCVVGGFAAAVMALGVVGPAHAQTGGPITPPDVGGVRIHRSMPDVGGERLGVAARQAEGQIQGQQGVLAITGADLTLLLGLGLASISVGLWLVRRRARS